VGELQAADPEGGRVEGMGNQRAATAARGPALLALLLLAAAAPACREPGTGPAPPGGDSLFVLDPARFAADVRPVLVAEGCNNALCHGGGLRGNFELSPPDDPDPDFDFAQAGQQVYGWDPLASPLLLKPLSQEAGGLDHAGAGLAGFDSTDDPGYRAIRDWILAGAWQ
jgi:hypothetical protein